MPTYQITGPNGEQFEVTGEGTEQDALAHVQSQYQAQQPQARGQRRNAIVASNPAEYDPGSPAFQERYGPTAVSGAENFDAGVGKSFMDIGRGAGQIYANIMDRLAPRRNLSSLIVDNSRSAEAQRRVDEAATLDAPLMGSGAGVFGDVAGQIAQFAAPSGVVGRGASLGANMLRSGAIGGALAGVQPVQTGQSRAVNTALGAAGGAAGEALAAGVGAVAGAASRKIAPEVKKLAQRARELGIPLRAEQVTGSRPLAGVSAALDTVPLAGRDASRKAQMMGFNRAVAKTFGEDTPNLAVAVQRAQSRLGGVYDDVLKSNAVRVDQQFVSELDDVMQAARAELNDAQFGVMARQVDNIMSKASGDAIDGQAAYNVKKMLDRIGRGSDTSLGHHATDLKNTLIGALDRSLPETASAQFNAARQQYGNLIAVRKLVKAGAEGGVSPAQLGNVKNLRGQLKEVADIGAQFLKEPFGNSGTANRLQGAGLLGTGAGAIANPAATAATLGTARATNMALDSSWLRNYLLNGNKTLQSMVPYLEKAAPAYLSTAAAGTNF